MQKRRRIKRSVPPHQPLDLWAQDIREQAAKFPAGSPEREALLSKARQADTAARLDDWANSPGLQAPG